MQYLKEDRMSDPKATVIGAGCRFFGKQARHNKWFQ